MLVNGENESDEDTESDEDDSEEDGSDEEDTPAKVRTYALGLSFKTLRVFS